MPPRNSKKTTTNPSATGSAMVNPPAITGDGDSDQTLPDGLTFTINGVQEAANLVWVPDQGIYAGHTRGSGTYVVYGSTSSKVKDQLKKEAEKAGINVRSEVWKKGKFWWGRLKENRGGENLAGKRAGGRRKPTTKRNAENQEKGTSAKKEEKIAETSKAAAAIKRKASDQDMESIAKKRKTLKTAEASKITRKSSRITSTTSKSAEASMKPATNYSKRVLRTLKSAEESTKQAPKSSKRASRTSKNAKASTKPAPKPQMKSLTTSKTVETTKDAINREDSTFSTITIAAIPTKPAKKRPVTTTKKKMEKIKSEESGEPAANPENPKVTGKGKGKGKGKEIAKNAAKQTAEEAQTSEPTLGHRVAFISGHRDYDEDHWKTYYIPALNAAIAANDNFLIGPSRGIDHLALYYLLEHGVSPSRITVHISKPEILVRRQFIALGVKVHVNGNDTLARDRYMTAASDYDILKYRTLEEDQAFYGEGWNKIMSNTERNYWRRVDPTELTDER